MVMIKSELARHVAQMGKVRNAYKILVGKPRGKRYLKRHRRKWRCNRFIKCVLEKQGVEMELD
jgi:hypothetical protein